MATEEGVVIKTTAAAEWAGKMSGRVRKVVRRVGVAGNVTITNRVTGVAALRASY